MFSYLKRTVLPLIYRLVGRSLSCVKALFVGALRITLIVSFSTFLILLILQLFIPHPSNKPCPCLSTDSYSMWRLRESHPPKTTSKQRRAVRSNHSAHKVASQDMTLVYLGRIDLPEGLS